MSLIPGDIRHILKTVSGLSDPIQSKTPPERITFYANDIDRAMIARDIMLLEIIHSLDLTLEDDLDFLITSAVCTEQSNPVTPIFFVFILLYMVLSLI
jgi:hypothetical protein